MGSQRVSHDWLTELNWVRCFSELCEPLGQISWPKEEIFWEPGVYGQWVKVQVTMWTCDWHPDLRESIESPIYSQWVRSTGNSMGLPMASKGKGSKVLQDWALNLWNLILYLGRESGSVTCSVMSDSLWPHGLQSTRFFYPWISQQDTGVGCHSFLQGIFLSQGLNLGLQHCRQILYRLSHQASPSG